MCTGQAHEIYVGFMVRKIQVIQNKVNEGNPSQPMPNIRY